MLSFLKFPDNVKSGAKRKLKINGVRPDPCGYDSNSVRPDPCGYDSDTEQEDTIHGRKRKKIKNRNYKGNYRSKTQILEFSKIPLRHILETVNPNQVDKRRFSR